jgi:hypothetical protein
LATVPFDEAVLEAELGGVALLDVTAKTSSVTQIQGLAELVTAL